MPDIMTIWVECVICAKRHDMWTRVWAADWAQHARWLCPGCVQAHIAMMALNGAYPVVQGTEALIYRLDDRTRASFAIMDPEQYATDLE